MRYGFLVTSFNRALQLHACLMSMIRTAGLDCPIWVLYHHSEPHRPSYDELKAEMAEFGNVLLIERGAFREFLIRALEDLPCERVLMTGDDTIFIRPCPLDIFDGYDLGAYVPSLRMGAHKDYCYHDNAPQRIPAFTVNPDGLLEWRMDGGIEYRDYNFPLLGDSHVFDRQEILGITKQIQFGNVPNEYERALVPFQPEFTRRKGLCFPEERLINICHNRVQNVDLSRNSGRSADELLPIWHAGKRILYEELAGKSFPSVMTEYEFLYVDRETR